MLSWPAPIAVALVTLLTVTGVAFAPSFEVPFPSSPLPLASPPAAHTAARDQHAGVAPPCRDRNRAADPDDRGRRCAARIVLADLWAVWDPVSIVEEPVPERSVSVVAPAVNATAGDQRAGVTVANGYCRCVADSCDWNRRCAARAVVARARPG